MSTIKLQTLILEKIKDDSNALKVFKEKRKEGTPLSKLAEFFNINPNSMKLSLKEQKVQTAYNIINEEYAKLSPIEKEYVSLVASKSKQRVYNQVKLIESFIPSLKSKKEKELAVECLKVLKQDVLKRPLEESAERTLGLKHTIKALLESDESYGGMVTKKLGNLKYLKDIRVSVLSDEADSPETLYITWSIAFYPLGNDFSSVKASLLDLDKRFSKMGRLVLIKVIREKERVGDVFTGEGIWDGGVKVNAVKPGEVSIGKGEFALHVVKGSISSLDDAKRVLVPVLRDLDTFIPEWFPEVDKTAQKVFRKNPDSNQQARLDALKRAHSSLKGPKGKDEFGGVI